MLVQTVERLALLRPRRLAVIIDPSVTQLGRCIACQDQGAGQQLAQHPHGTAHPIDSRAAVPICAVPAQALAHATDHAQRAGGAGRARGSPPRRGGIAEVRELMNLPPLYSGSAPRRAARRPPAPRPTRARARGCRPPRAPLALVRCKSSNQTIHL